MVTQTYLPIYLCNSSDSSDSSDSFDLCDSWKSSDSSDSSDNSYTSDNSGSSDKKNLSLFFFFLIGKNSKGQNVTKPKN